MTYGPVPPSTHPAYFTGQATTQYNPVAPLTKRGGPIAERSLPDCTFGPGLPDAFTFA